MPQITTNTLNALQDVRTALQGFGEGYSSCMKENNPQKMALIGGLGGASLAALAVPLLGVSGPVGLGIVASSGASGALTSTAGTSAYCALTELAKRIQR